MKKVHGFHRVSAAVNTASQDDEVVKDLAVAGLGC